MGGLTWVPGDVLHLDSDVIIYSVERIEPYYKLLLPLWLSANAGEIQLAGSELLLLETMVRPLRQANADLQVAFRNLLTNTRFKLMPITRPVLEQVAGLRAEYGIKTPDSIQAATAVIAKCTAFLSNDHGYLRVAGLPVKLLDHVLTE